MAVVSVIKQFLFKKVTDYILKPLFLSDVVGSTVRGAVKFVAGVIAGLGATGVSDEVLGSWADQTTAIGVAVAMHLIGQIVSWVAKKKDEQ